MCDIPVPVADEEKIVRAILSPFHVDPEKRKLKKATFRSAKGTDEVSVIRQTYKGSDFCKSKAREIALRSPVKKYVGLAVLAAAQIRNAKSEVSDSRNEYCGHAHISHGIVVPQNEPLPPDQSLALDAKLDALCKAAIFHIDPNPESETWLGPAL